MEKVADALITEAMTGNIAAIKEIGDRIDGKSTQIIDATVSTHESAIDALK
jgi:hypothetical protein